MTDLGELRQGAAAARQALASAGENLAELRRRLRGGQNRLEHVLRRGQAGEQEARAIQAELERLQAARADGERAAAAAKEEFHRLWQSIPESPWDLVEQLPDDLPFLLLPVRVEARFMPGAAGRELWVRIFPDDIAVHTHEKGLTAAEVSDGHAFWREMWTASRETDQPTRQALEQGAWAKLARSSDSRRAAWIADQTRPETLDVSSADDLSFPAVDPQSLKSESWSRAPCSTVMPDRFVVMGYIGGERVFRQAGAPVPDPLVLGPDPLRLEVEYRQTGGELQTGADFAWVGDFDQAVAKGMGLRIPLDATAAERGLDRLLVLGLRLSSDAVAGQDLVEELFDNHHYAADGMSLLPQGTPTNNADGKGSGFSSAGPDPAESFALEVGPPAFEPTGQPHEKTDAQRLAEALGIGYAPLQRLDGAGGRDLREARRFNTALFPATLGYYLEEMLDLDLGLIARVRDFFTGYVTGRGPLPAVRVGSQPYGVLLSSDFSAWQWSERELGGQPGFLNGMLGVIRRLQETWRQLAASASRIGATADPDQDFLRALGLNAASIEFYRRHATGKETIWNFYAFTPGRFYGPALMENIRRQALALLQELGLPLDPPPRLFDLAFFVDHDQILDPLVDDVAADETEKLSETKLLKKAYRIPDPANPDGFTESSYLGWLAHSAYDDLKQQRLRHLSGEDQPVPRPLLYRLLRSALLLSVHDAATRLYARFDVLPLTARREVEIANVTQDRTVTRWELLDAEVGHVLPALSQANLPVGAWLLTPDGHGRPEALTIEAVRAALADLVDLPTARLERILVEHLDLCSYRLDAWQMGFFARRLELQRFVSGNEGPGDGEAPPDSLRRTGLYLGAFGWLEDLRPGPSQQKADTTGIPVTLYDPTSDGDLFEQPDNGGFIHAPSLNHAVAAAVLRGAYLTHFDPARPETMAVNLSSDRVRTALSFIEGVRNGQELGALLGYQFERGLHDRYDDPSLNQYLPLFRVQYPLLADKITPDESGSPIETKESRNVLDGYALVEAAFLRATPVAYPYGVEGLPADPASPHAVAVQAEVARLADSLDAIADLLLAEGVFQVTEGNFERAAASIKTLAEGGLPPEPEIARTPRSGLAITQRVALHLPGETGPGSWPGAPTERARVEPGLNRWLGEHLPAPDRIVVKASWEGHPPHEQSLADLGLQPIDLVLLAGDEILSQETELEKRLASAIRVDQHDDDLQVTFEFMAEPADPASANLFPLLPLLRRLRNLVTTARPLSALDFRLPSEANTNPAENLNPQGYDLDELDGRLQTAIGRFDTALADLAAAIPVDGNGDPVVGAIVAETVRGFILALARFGLPDAVPLSAAGDSDRARQTLGDQGLRLLKIGHARLVLATAARTSAADASRPASERLADYRQAAQELFGPSFNLVPRFSLSALSEVQAAAAFRDAPPDQGLTRSHHENPLLVDEWLQGVARARQSMGDLEQVLILSELFATPGGILKPLQLPFRAADHWVAVEFPPVRPEQIGQPGVFYPQGEFVSLVQCLPASGFDPAAQQSGLLVDEWSEVIPGKVETTGIAVHYNQPSTEPPQVLLLAVTPQITGQWTWGKLEGILNDTLERVRQRAVEPDQLGSTALGHLLPAVLSAVTTRRFATISTDLTHQTAIRE
ncbi:hypothetical protein [Micromonospora sp. NPDC000668]|uniref:hypothetical protein n=1 Tax=Micromonospora sp. NPDC000668 TaxID=3364219 RepID=UPI0036A05CC0